MSHPIPDTDFELRGDDALIVCDVQNDFLPGGALGVPSADGLIHTVNRYIAAFRSHGLPVIATRDWHPPDHCSFTAEGGPWPAHCVANTDGAAFPAALQLPDDALVVDKGTAREREAYSGFQDTGLCATLRARGVERVFVAGIATDYCVLDTVLDALEAGFEVVLLEDAMRAVNVNPGDDARALDEMLQHGALSVEDLTATV